MWVAYDFLRHIGEAESRERGIDHLVGAVEHELPVDAHFELAASLLELPGIEPTMGRQAQVDAAVLDRSCGRRGFGCVLK